MNGRLYDPVIARFFSPDKYVANSSFTQDFNRYTYARNCPLMYTDPDGENPVLIPLLVIGSLWCAIQGGIIAQQRGATGWNMAAYIVGGAAIGAISAIGAYGMGVGIATAGFGAVTGTVSGALSGLMAGTINGAGMAILAGKSPRDIYYSTLYGGLMGMGMGAFMGGIADIYDAISRGGYGEIGGGNGKKAKFLSEKIPPGTKPTATGELAVTKTNPNYGKYGMTRNGGRKAHYGVDYAGEIGDDVYAIYPGKVIKNGYSNDFGPYHVQTESYMNGYTYTVDYGHMSSSSLKVDDWVNGGDLIGLIGKEGNLANTDYPAHVHIAVSRPVVINGVAYKGYVQPSWQPWVPVDIFGNPLYRRFW
jgi:hypothetical protein